MPEEKENISNEKLFTTRDLYLASTLVTLKFFMVKIEYMIEGTKNQAVGWFPRSFLVPEWYPTCNRRCAK